MRRPGGGHTGGMESLRHSGSVHVARSPEAVYDLVSDVTRTGEWSPICRECRWESEARGVGAVFVGLLESFGSFWASAFKEVIVFTLIIPVLLWRSFQHGHDDEEE